MTGIQFLRYMGQLMGDQRSKKSYKSLIYDIGLEGAGNKKIKSYSFGMKKKISIAQALLGNTDLIILDEPTSGLDPESAINIRKLITDLQKQEKTILLTSHNLDEVDKISDRVGILSEGELKRLGTPQKLKAETEAGVRIAVRTQPVLREKDVQKLTEQLRVDVSFVEIRNEFTVLHLASEEDIPVLAKELINSDILLYEIKVEEGSLEEVFMNT